MAETRYIISDAAKMINVEPHVLRYWEEELAIEIPRNELGHRYYTDKEIHLFENIRDLKEKGFQLKAIRMIISTLNEDAPFGDDGETSDDRDGEDVDMFEQNAVHVRDNCESWEAGNDADEKADKPTDDCNKPVKADIHTVEQVSAEDKMKHFKYIMNGIVTEALQDNNPCLEEAMDARVTEVVMRELGQMEARQEQQSERYYKLLDESIRGRQRFGQEVAAAKVPPYGGTSTPRRKRKLFGRRYKY